MSKIYIRGGHVVKAPVSHYGNIDDYGARANFASNNPEPTMR